MSPRKRTRRPTALVVDDDPEACLLLAGILGEEGYEVLTAHGGREAVETISTSRPPLTLLDIVMPDMDGVSVLREIRRRGHRGTVIMVTGRGTLQTAREAMLLGAYDYITKPISLKYLKSVLEEAVCDRSQSLRKRACEY